MKKVTLATFLLCGFTCLSAHSVDAQAASKVPYSDCEQIAQRWVADLAAKAQTPAEAAESFVNVPKHVTCFAALVPSISRTSVLKVLAESFSNSKQQSAPSGSSGSTSAVSKPAGSTSLIQDVGGVSATSNGSSLTLQFAPGDLVEELASDGVFDFCTATIQTQGCKSSTWLKVFAPATLSVTANTTTPAASVKGTATATGTAVPATLQSAPNTLSFGALTAKYSFLYPKKDAKTVAKDLQTAAQTLSSSLGTFQADLSQCNAYNNWKSEVENDAKQALENAGNDNDSKSLYSFLVRSYNELSIRMASDHTCQSDLSKLQSVVNTVAAYQAAIAAESVIAKSSTPLLGLEYDFTTPPNKPSYHTAKLNFSWQSSTSCNTQLKTAASKALEGVNPKATLDNSIAATCSDAPAGAAAKKVPSVSTSATPSWNIAASGGVDIYNDEPSSAIPSASHLRDVQAGAEITRVWHISTYKHENAALAALFSKLGDLSLVGAYYYQDQTSPSILNGPPSSITFNGLPTTASQVFATRGPINVGQIRLGFGTGTNIRFPIAVSYSNRSDLIVHPFVGVQFGVSYDLFGK